MEVPGALWRYSEICRGTWGFVGDPKLGGGTQVFIRYPGLRGGKPVLCKGTQGLVELLGALLRYWWLDGGREGRQGVVGIPGAS